MVKYVLQQFTAIAAVCGDLKTFFLLHRICTVLFLIYEFFHLLVLVNWAWYFAVRSTGVPWRSLANLKHFNTTYYYHSTISNISVPTVLPFFIWSTHPTTVPVAPTSNLGPVRWKLCTCIVLRAAGSQWICRDEPYRRRPAET